MYQVNVPDAQVADKLELPPLPQKLLGLATREVGAVGVVLTVTVTPVPALLVVPATQAA